MIVVTHFIRFDPKSEKVCRLRMDYRFVQYRTYTISVLYVNVATDRTYSAAKI